MEKEISRDYVKSHILNLDGDVKTVEAVVGQTTEATIGETSVVAVAEAVVS